MVPFIALYIVRRKFAQRERCSTSHTSRAGGQGGFGNRAAVNARHPGEVLQEDATPARNDWQITSRRLAHGMPDFELSWKEWLV